MQKNEQRIGRLLGLYQQILQQGEIATDNSAEQIDLRLTGLVVQQMSKLRVYNRTVSKSQSFLEALPHKHFKVLSYIYLSKIYLIVDAIIIER
ncbi:hypothetical protein [Tolypothrix sp. VBCCA 56010]|uniref:hypothetical protein n=1 Tax=Tolypothrix sp. VBCCA 56010 TaxID=3137731 RepID=UPI003D7E0C34